MTESDPTAAHALNAPCAAEPSTGWFRLEYALGGVLALLLGGYLIAYFVFGVDLNALRSWGYLGIFLLALAGSAFIVLPTPSGIAVFSGGALLQPVYGIPAPLLVGLVAGLGEAIGEFSGYALGYAGSGLLKHQMLYARFEGLMTTHGVLGIFLLSMFPLDIAGPAAGASHMPPQQFFPATLAGKIIKDLAVAYAGTLSFGIAHDIL